MNAFVNWCKENYLEVNVSKTKEMIFDFRKTKSHLEPLTINNERVEGTEVYKYLGMHIDNQFSWQAHVDTLVKKLNQRLYFIRKLNSFKVNVEIIKTFYLSSVQSLILFGITCWGGNIRKVDKIRINRAIRKAEKIIKLKLKSVDELYEDTVLKKAEAILKDSAHPLNDQFTLSARSNKVLAVSSNTERFKKSFIPSASRILRGVK